MEITINGRQYMVESTNDMAAGHIGYYLKGKRNAFYGAMRTRENPSLLFLVNGRNGMIIPGVWLTDADNELKVC